MAKIHVKDFNIEISMNQWMELNMTLLFDQQIDTSIVNDTEILEAYLTKTFYGDDNGNRTPTEEKYLDIITRQNERIKDLQYKINTLQLNDAEKLKELGKKFKGLSNTLKYNPLGSEGKEKYD